MKPIYVLDTNVILHDPTATTRFPGATVVLPIYVIEELDRFKRDISGLGRNAREFSRALDEVRQRGKLTEGVTLDNGAVLRVSIVNDPTALAKAGGYAEGQKYDNLILECAVKEQREHPDCEVTFISQDTNLRIRADVIGLKAIDYEPDRVEMEDLYGGHREADVSPEQLQEAFGSGLVLDDDFHANEFVLLRDITRPNHTGLGRFYADQGLIRALPRRRDVIWGIQPRNMEQSFALNLLLDDDVKLVTLVGKAGTGKTLLALAAALQKVTEDDAYQKVLVSRPIFPLGRDIGYLPGTVEEKLDPWMKPIHDNLDLLLNLNPAARRQGRGSQELFDLGLLEIEPLTYIRGRSLPRQYLIIDEAQNLTPHEVKTILTRAGEDSKLVFTGDPYQIDNPYVDTTNNGLVHLVNKFQGQPIAGTVTLTRGERSPLAELAANIL
ncbi:PhoH family protein [Myxococcota bacterium]|nr:PhoH family protein [Myxococcota bacterium]MBU1429099.1 PhoH family protein [Myxococcota bacterium]MBU1898139.1 PhoH family protein [Myxococcota bacterium]